MATGQDISLSIPRRSRNRSIRLVGGTVVYAILILGTIVTLVPFVWAVLTSLKPVSEILRVPPTFLPQTWTLKSYLTIFNDPNVPIFRFFFNSLFVAVMHVVITLFTSSLAGYVFAKFRFMGRNASFSFILAQMMVPFQVVMIPTYLILVKLHLVNSLFGLIVPGIIDSFGIFLMRQFIESIPSELIDAARIDGASEFAIYWQIILPQLGASLATLGIFNFMASWNDYLWPLIVITTQEKRTLPLLLTWYNTAHGTRYDLTMAASVLVLLPILVVYIFFQRWIVRGVALTGFK